MLNNKLNHNGFTLIELVMTITIIVILAAAIFVVWPSFPIKTTAQAGLLASDIRYTQNLAMAKAERHRLVITSSNSYQITNSAGAAITLPSGNSMVVLGGGISFGAITNLPNNLIAFDSRGIPYVDTSSPGTALSTTATITLAGNGSTNTISIYPATGWVISS